MRAVHNRHMGAHSGGARGRHEEERGTECVAVVFLSGCATACAGMRLTCSGVPRTSRRTTAAPGNPTSTHTHTRQGRRRIQNPQPASTRVCLRSQQSTRPPARSLTQTHAPSSPQNAEKRLENMASRRRRGAVECVPGVGRAGGHLAVDAYTTSNAAVGAVGAFQGVKSHKIGGTPQVPPGKTRNRPTEAKLGRIMHLNTRTEGNVTRVPATVCPCTRYMQTFSHAPAVEGFQCTV